MKLLSQLLPLMTLSLAYADPLPRSCNDLEEDVRLPSQVYTIYPVEFGSGVEAFCDMDTDKGCWTVFLRRQDGELNFYRPWLHYRENFGDPNGEHWLGLENLYHLTKDGSYELRVVLEDFDGNKVWAHYDSFYLDAECDGYTMHVSGFKDGGAGDSMRFHDGQKFSTFDKDQDSSPSNCARRYLGAFWYSACYNTNPTGIYQWGPVRDHYSNGIIWSGWKGFAYSVKAITMMVRSQS